MSEYLFKANFDIKNCLTCPIANMVVNCPCFTGEAFASDFTDSKHPNCPLVKVPPHGDLVDRDYIKANGLSLNDAPTVLEASKEGE